MPRIKAGSPEAHARAKKAAATRARNKALGRAKTRPLYQSRPTRPITRNLKLKYTIKPPKLIALRAIRTASNDELRRNYALLGSPKRYGIPDNLANEKRYYAVRDELSRRATPKIRTFIAEFGNSRKAKAHKAERLERHRSARGVKKQRGRK